MVPKANHRLKSMATFSHASSWEFIGPCGVTKRVSSQERMFLTLPMLRLLSSKAQGRKDFWKTSKPCHVGIHWIDLVEYSQMSTHLRGFQSFKKIFLHHILLAKLATSRISRGLAAYASSVSFGHAEHCFLTVWTSKSLCQNLLKMTFLRR